MVPHVTGQMSPSVASVQMMLRECLRQLDVLGLSIPATHVDHALALLIDRQDNQLIDLLRIADDLVFVSRSKSDLH